jgi:hypothetical protein
MGEKARRLEGAGWGVTPCYWEAPEGAKVFSEEYWARPKNAGRTLKSDSGFDGLAGNGTFEGFSLEYRSP